MCVGYLFNDFVVIFIWYHNGLCNHAPDNGKNVVDGLNVTDKRYLKEQMKLLGKLTRNDTSNIVMLRSESNNDSIKRVDHYLHILTTNNRSSPRFIKTISLYHDSSKRVYTRILALDPTASDHIGMGSRGIWGRERGGGGGG